MRQRKDITWYQPKHYLAILYWCRKQLLGAHPGLPVRQGKALAKSSSHRNQALDTTEILSFVSVLICLTGKATEFSPTDWLSTCLQCLGPGCGDAGSQNSTQVSHGSGQEPKPTEPSLPPPGVCISRNAGVRRQGIQLSLSATGRSSQLGSRVGLWGQRNGRGLWGKGKGWHYEEKHNTEAQCQPVRGQ